MAKAVNTSPAGGMKWGRQPNAAEKIRAEKQNHSKSKVSGLSSWVTGEAELKMGFVIVGIVLLLDAAVMFWLKRGVDSTGVFALAVGLFALVYYFYKRRISALMMRKNNEKYMKKQEIFIDADGIRVQTDQAEVHYQFGAVEEIYFWRNSYVLYLDKNRVLPLPVRSFLEGDPKEFGTYISEQCAKPVQTPADKKNKEH